MVLGGFDSTLRMVSQNGALMSQGDNFRVVNSLSSVVQAIQNLAMQSGGIGGMLGNALMGKLMELDGVLTTLGPQHLASMGIQVGGAPMMPFSPNMPMQNQNFYYPPMGPQFGQQMPPQMMQPQMQPQMMQQPMQQQPIQQMQQPAPQPPPVQEVQPVAPPPAPAAVAPPPSAPTPPPSTPLPAVSVESNSGGGVNVFMGIPGAGAGSDKPAKGRDYLLNLLSQK